MIWDLAKWLSQRSTLALALGYLRPYMATVKFPNRLGENPNPQQSSNRTVFEPINYQRNLKQVQFPLTLQGFQADEISTTVEDLKIRGELY